MSNPFVAEIRIFPFNFPPTGWAFCNGQLLPISQNTALFSLLGTTYGGDGKSNFALPNMQGNAMLGPGQGPGLSLRDLGETGGEPTVTLLQTEIPSHPHPANCSSLDGAMISPQNNVWGDVGGRNVKAYTASAAVPPLVALNGSAIAPTGGSQPHNNMPPFLTLSYCIALQGIFPPRS
jgi:microcystin-dependent protein